MQEEGQNYWEADQQDIAITTPLAERPFNPISWEASEYIHHQKDVLWFFGLVAVSAILISVSIFLVQSWTFTALLVVMIVSVIVFALRPPRTLRYTLSDHFLQIGDKRYDLNEFRAFGVLQEGPLYSILLLPVRRFMPAVTLYFPGDHGEDIVDQLGTAIPMEEVDLDLIDKLVRKLRF